MPWDCRLRKESKCFKILSESFGGELCRKKMLWPVWKSLLIKFMQQTWVRNCSETDLSCFTTNTEIYIHFSKFVICPSLSQLFLLLTSVQFAVSGGPPPKASPKQSQDLLYIFVCAILCASPHSLYHSIHTFDVFFELRLVECQSCPVRLIDNTFII